MNTNFKKGFRYSFLFYFRFVHGFIIVTIEFITSSSLQCQDFNSTAQSGKKSPDIDTQNLHNFHGVRESQNLQNNFNLPGLPREVDDEAGHLLPRHSHDKYDLFFDGISSLNLDMI
uniref:Uncharacterized protein n=1 Tax=Glossina brevipalpis TaxID=37001 RepID=A0A1A9W2S3_9MUSC